MNGASQIGAVDQYRQIAQPAQPQDSGRAPFADLIRDFVSDTSTEQAEAHQSVKDLVSGEANNIHEVVLTASEAEIAFRLMMEIRNRLISSYQEIIRMQV